jgi:hypothetical protein
MPFWNRTKLVLEHLIERYIVEPLGTVPPKIEVVAVLPHYNHQKIPVEALAQLILRTNNSSKLFGKEAVWAPPGHGSIIHKIDSQVALYKVALAFDQVDSENDGSLELQYMLGCVSEESLFDPDAQNGNLLGSNKANDPLGYDVGLCQLKLRYLSGATEANVDSMRLLALDPVLALRAFYKKMLGLYAWAQSIQPHLNSSAINPKATNLLWLTTGAYNFGEDGMLALVEKGAMVGHSDDVTKNEVNFAAQLGVPSLMKELL